MRIREYVGSAAEAVKRHAPDVSPVKNGCTAAFTKIAEPLKTATFPKMDHIVRISRLCRRETSGAYENIPAEKVEEREGLISTPVKTNSCSYGGAARSVSYSYGFLTFAKLGYTVRVKVAYRIVNWISDDGTESKSKSSVTIYSTNFVHESDDGDKFILDIDDLDTAKNESKSSFAKMVDDIKEWMSSPTTRSRISKYTTLFAENVCIYALQHGLTLCGGAFSVILFKTLIVIVIDLVIEKVDPGKQHSVNGSKECIPGVEMDDQWYSSAFQFLKEKVGVYALRECLDFILNEFSVFLRTEAFRSFSRGGITAEYLKSVMKRFLVFLQKRYCGAGFFIIQAIVMVAMRKYMYDDQSENEWGFHGSATKGEKKKKKKKNTRISTKQEHKC